MDYFKAVTSNNLAKLIYEESLPIKKRLHPKDTTSEPPNYDKILQAVGSARVVLIGEASHGTEEFYQHRAEITKRLICEKDFNIVALEADWPDTHRVCSYVRGNGEDKNAVESLGEFKRFPRWMWRNTVMVDFVEWLKEHNDKLEYDEKVGIFGLDLYSLHSSRAEVIKYLEKFHPEAVAEAKKRYSCFDHYGDEGQAYGYSVGFGLSKGCQQEAVKQLSDMLASKTKWLDADKSLSNADRLFYANQNAKVVKDAETYYRNMFQSSNVTWNIRDKHMVDALGDLLKHFTETKRGAKAIVWAHNSHVGDTKGRVKEYNIGQLARERYGQENTFNIGFSTFSGTVTAADNWDEPPNRMKVRNALEGSYEQLFHEASLIHDEQTKHQKQDFCLLFRSNSGSNGVVSEKLAKQMAKERLERAIGVVYRPSTERWSHYFEVNLADQFDCIIHFDSTRALTPLEREPQWKEGADEMDETFPFGV